MEIVFDGQLFNDLLEFVLLLILIIYDFICSFYRMFIPKRLKSLEFDIILITGSASGIGKAVCFHLVVAGAKSLVLWDINKMENENLARSLRDMGANIQTYEVDVVDKESVARTAEIVRRDVGDVTILFNNAGIAHISDFFQSQPQQLERTIQVNLISHFWALREFLPPMLKRRKGQVVTSCSVLGLRGVVNGVAYCGSKFGVRGYLEAIESELRHMHSRPDIKFTTIYPFFVNTPMVENLKLTYRLHFLFKHLDSDTVAAKIVKGIRQESHSVHIPSYLHIINALQYFLPQASRDRLIDFAIRDIDYENVPVVPDKGSSHNDLFYPERNPIVAIAGR